MSHAIEPAAQAVQGVHPSADQHVPQQRSAPRVVIVGKPTFAWLRQFQEQAPAPRMDLRYLVEGGVELVAMQPARRDLWLTHARAALVAHVAHSTQPAGPETSGTVAAASGDEGATARTSVAPAANRSIDRHSDGKALQIGEAVFQVLKRVQGTTRDPRLEMRYLVEGAIELLRQEPVLLPAVVTRARQALIEHLAQLQSTPVQPIPMELST